MDTQRAAPVWDLPTRVFHWSLLPLLAAAWTSAEQGWMDVHAWCGYSLLTLLLFRVAWGFAGSTHSRFADFLRGPSEVIAHFRGNAAERPGHNAAGGWSVMAMLSLLLVQGLTGLFNEDDISFSGPLSHLAGKMAGAIHEWHELNFDLLLVLVVVHVATILLYLKRGRNLLRAMVWGGVAAPGARQTPAWLALAFLAVAALALWGVLRLLPAPPPVFL
ncbi:MAG: cytochrome b/b6 domain-containing protein [Gammaproteobacteria bacterium]